MAKHNLDQILRSAVLAGAVATSGAYAKGNPNDADITNYLEPNANIVILENAGRSTSAVDPVVPRDNQYFIVGETGQVNLDTADDITYDGTSIVEGQVTRGRGKMPGYVDGLENYTGHAIAVTKGRDKENPVEVREARADLHAYAAPFSNCPPGQTMIVGDFKFPEAINDTVFEGVNGLIFIGQYANGEPYELLASGVDTNDNNIRACADNGYTVQVDSVRSIQDMYTTETIDLDSDSWNMTLAGFKIVGLDEDGDGLVDLPDADQNGTLDGAGIEISCNSPFARTAYVVMDPPSKPYSVSKINNVNGFEVVPPRTISYTADCQDASTTVSPQISVSDGVNTRYLTIDYNVTN